MHFIREATINDAEAIRRIADLTWQDVYGPILKQEQISFMLEEIYAPAKLRGQIKNKEQTFLMLIEDERPVAFAGFSARSENPEIYKLHKLYCLPETQGKGYGKIMLNAVIEKTIAASIHTLDLNVNRYNNAKGFYEKMGFEVVYEEDIPIGPYFMNDFVMRKEL